MNLSAQEITAQLLMLPKHEQQEALDFIEFLKNKPAHGKVKRKNATLNQKGQPTEKEQRQKNRRVLGATR